jgi:hypothetical protein
MIIFYDPWGIIKKEDIIRWINDDCERSVNDKFDEMFDETSWANIPLSEIPH